MDLNLRLVFHQREKASLEIKLASLKTRWEKRGKGSLNGSPIGTFVKVSTHSYTRPLGPNIDEGPPFVACRRKELKG